MTKYWIATQRTDNGDPNIVEGAVITRYFAVDAFLTDDESKAHRYNGDGDAQTVRDDLNNQFPHARFYLVEASRQRND